MRKQYKLALISPKGAFLSSNKNFIDFFNENKFMHRYKKTWTGLSSALTIIAALTPNNFQIDIIDENIEDINFNLQYDIIGLSVMTQQAMRAYEIAQIYKSKGTKVILGGYHPTVLPDEAIKYADSVVIGEAELLWPQVIQDFENSNLKRIYQSEEVFDLQRSPLPNFSLIKDKKYPILWIQTTRACPHDCEFCCASKIFGYKYRTKPVEKILKEIGEIKTFFGDEIIIGFADDNFFASKKFSSSLLSQLIKKNIKWVTQTDISIGAKNDILKKIKQSGCIDLFIGFESLRKENLLNLDSKNWKLKQREYYERNIRNIQSYGIGVMGAFIVGLKHDDESVFQQISDFVIQNNLIDAQISILTPLPGTRLRMKMLEENRILHSNWDHYTMGECVFFHDRLSKEQLEMGLLEIYKKINTPENYYNRLDFYKSVFKRLINQEKAGL